MNDLLVVALCDGPRCRGLRGLCEHDPTVPIRDAVAASTNAVLVQCSCLGRCHEGCVAFAGPAREDGGRMSFSVLPRLDRPGAAEAAAAWIAERS